MKTTLRRQSATRRVRTVASFVVLVAVIVSVLSAHWSSDAAAPVAAPANCTAPGIQIATDPAGDQFGAQPLGQNGQQDLVAVSIAEEYDFAGRGTLVATMKVSQLDPNALPRNANWVTFFTARHADNTTTEYFVSADTNETGAISYNYGHVDGSNNVTNGTADNGTLSAAGKTLTVKLALEKVKKPVAATPLPTLTGATVDLSAGKTISNVRGQTYMLIGATTVGGLLQDIDNTNGGSYSFVGAAACAPEATPTPTPTATPTPTNGGGGDPAACVSANTILRTDPTSDQTGNPAANQQLDIQSISIAEDYRILNSERLIFKMKVANLSTLPANGVWRTVFTVGASSFFVSMNTDLNSVVFYEYGTVTGTTVAGLGAPDEASFTPDGNITISIANSKVGNPQAGTTLTAISGRTQQFVGTTGTGAFLNMDSTTPDATYSLAGKSPSCTPTAPVSGATYLKGGIDFSPTVALQAPATVRDGEPSLRVDKYGNAYVSAIRGVPAGNDLWYIDLRPTVGGQPNPNYDPFMRNPQYRGQPDAFTGEGQPSLLADGGGDVDLAVSFPDSDTENPNAPPTLTFTSLALANISTAKSTDRGITFTKNPAGNVTGGLPIDDRQWFEAVGANTVYMIYRTAAPAVTQIQRSNDGGLTWGPARTAGAIGQVGSVDVHKATGTVYLSGSTGQVCVGTPLSPLDEPLTYTCKQAAPANANIFFVVKVADDGTPNGTAYVTFSDGRSIFIAYSSDKGQTWSTPIRVNDGLETRTSLFPWIETGPVPGSLGIVWYATDSATNTNDSNWRVYFASATGANTNAPTFRQVEAGDHIHHASNISLSGLDPTNPNVNRNLIDYFQIAFDPTGAAVIAYTDDHNDFDGNTYVMRQISGASIKGGNIPTPVEGSALPAPAPLSADGSQVVDPPMDARTSTVITRTAEPVDIVSIKYSAEPGTGSPVLVATMKVTDLTVIPPSGSWRMAFAANAPDSVLSPTGQFTFGVADRGDQFFVQALTDAAGAQTYRFGTAARNGDGSIAYTDRGAADGGAFDQTAKTITVRVSLNKLNPFVKQGNPPVGAGSVLVGLRGAASVAAQGNAARSDNTRGGTQYTITLPSSNVALTSNGSTASASSVYAGRNYSAASAIDGDRIGANWETGGGWNDNTRDAYPDWLQVDFNASRTINEIRVITLQDDFTHAQEPTPTMTCNLYGLLDYDVQYWNGVDWATVPGGQITGNNLVMRTLTFPDITTTKIRVVVHNARQHHSRVVEVEAIGN
ncbi:MAG TPA: discoidin domain-containing protein [Pyrinomonadaceae bacterium]|jgi:hypothetical protein